MRAGFAMLIGMTALLAAGSGATPAAAAAPHAAAPPAHRVELNRAFMVGYWTDDDNCDDAIRFAADGSFVVATGGTGRWTLAGDRLTLTGRKIAIVRVVPIDRDSIRVINPDGSLGRSTRCPAPPPADTPISSDIA